MSYGKAVVRTAALIAALTASALPAAAETQIVARGGTAVMWPEMTVAAADLAITQKADGVLIQLAQTADGALVVRPGRDLANSTNAADALGAAPAGRGGPDSANWFVDQISAASYDLLRARQTDPARDRSYDGVFPVARLGDFLSLVRDRSQQRGRKIGLIIVIEGSSYYADRKMPIEARLVEQLKTNGLDQPDSGVWLAAREPSSLKILRSLTQLPLMFVVGAGAKTPPDAAVTGDRRSYGAYLTSQGLADVRGFADGVLVDRSAVTVAGGAVVADARAAGLKLYLGGFAVPGTPALPREQSIADYRAILGLGVDGIVTDEPLRAVEARARR